MMKPAVTRALLVGLLVLGLPVTADEVPDNASPAAPPKDNVRGHIVSYGLYETVAAAKTHNAAAPRFKHAARVTLFAASQCMRFGYRFALEGLPVRKDSSDEQLDIVVHHPPMLDDEGNARIVSTARIKIHPTAGRFENFLVYTLRKRNEMLPGKWRLEVHRKGRMLVGKTFTLLEGLPADPERTCD
jgi:hypothetical protein